MREEYRRIYPELDKQLPRECGNCGSTRDLEIHHIVPLSFGGTNRLSNLVRLCIDCHAKAHGGLSFVEKSRESLRGKAAIGKRTLGSIPMGYRYDDDKFTINEEEAEVVRLIFRMRYKGEYSTSNIAKALNHLAIPTHRGAKEWAHPTVKRILDNERYFGKYIFEGIDYGNIMPPILDEEIKQTIRDFESKYEGKRVPPKILTTS